MKDEYLEEILNGLRFIYPNLIISICIKDSNGKLIVRSERTNDKTLLRFNSEFLEMQLDEGGPEFIKTVIRQFAEIIEKKFLKNIKRFANSNGVFGRPSKILSISQLQYAAANSLSCTGAAKVLGVHVDTFKKYCLLLDPSIYYNRMNRNGNGITKGGLRAKVKLQDVFAGKNPNFRRKWLKERLIKENFLEERCSQCGYDERRTLDNKVPLVLDFKDGQPKNRTLENLRLLCYNCSFLLNPRSGSVGVRRLAEIREVFDMEKELMDREIDDKLFDEFNKNPDTEKIDIFNKFNK